jgi:DNA modification methylase
MPTAKPPTRPTTSRQKAAQARQEAPGPTIGTLDDLTPDPANRRTHNPRNLAMLADALRVVGASRSIVVDEAGVILAGNGVVEAASAAGLTKLQIVDADGDTVVAVRRRGLTDVQKRQLAIYDNRTAELAEWNVAQLAADLQNGEDLTAFFLPSELSSLLGAVWKQGRTDPDDVPDPRATDILAGDLFELGDHRLLCGSAVVALDVARVLGGQAPALMVTDPPYGVNYDASWRADAGVNRNPNKLGPVTNDDNADWTPAWTLSPAAAAYVWHAGLKASIVEASLSAAGYTLRSQIIWAKDRMALGRGDYHWQHEPCWYAVREGATGGRTENRQPSTLWRISLERKAKRTTLWEVAARDDSGHGHSTQKPVECMARPMRYHQAPSVYDPFVGSGTTIIAAEQLGRACYALELEPTYVQVAIDRWEAFTGCTAVKVGEAVRA